MILGGIGRHNWLFRCICALLFRSFTDRIKGERDLQTRRIYHIVSGSQSDITVIRWQSVPSKSCDSIVYERTSLTTRGSTLGYLATSGAQKEIRRGRVFGCSIRVEEVGEAAAGEVCKHIACRGREAYCVLFQVSVGRIHEGRSSMSSSPRPENARTPKIQSIDEDRLQIHQAAKQRGSGCR